MPSDCRILRNHFDDTFFAVYLASTQGCEVGYNRITGRRGAGEAGTGNGVHSWSSRSARIHDNVIRGHRDGIYLEFNRDADVRNNLSAGNLRYGMHFMYSDSSRYLGNTFASNGSGVAVMYTKVVTITGNTFTDNGGPTAYGLLLKEIEDAQLERQPLPSEHHRIAGRWRRPDRGTRQSLRREWLGHPPLRQHVGRAVHRQ